MTWLNGYPDESSNAPPSRTSHLAKIVSDPPLPKRGAGRQITDCPSHTPRKRFTINAKTVKHLEFD
jgi:hypothetical protein